MAEPASDPLPALAASILHLEVPAECVSSVAATLAVLRDHAERVESFFAENPEIA
jgi:hypothetical protein